MRLFYQDRRNISEFIKIIHMHLLKGGFFFNWIEKKKGSSGTLDIKCCQTKNPTPSWLKTSFKVSQYLAISLFLSPLIFSTFCCYVAPCGQVLRPKVSFPLSQRQNLFANLETRYLRSQTHFTGAFSVKTFKLWHEII